MMKPIQKLKENDFFKKKETSKKVFQKLGYCKTKKRYYAVDCDDIANDIYLKKDTLIFEV